MALANLTLPPSAPRGVRYVSPDERARVLGELAASKFVTADASHAPRGRLGEAALDSIEEALLGLGAPPAGLTPILARGSRESCWAAMLGDQLFRMRSMGLEGICVALGPLRSLASDKIGRADAGIVERIDADAFRFLADASRSKRLVLLLDEGDRPAAPVAIAAPQPTTPFTAPASLASPAPPESLPSAPVLPMPVKPNVVRAPAGKVMNPGAHTAGAAVAKPQDVWRRWSLDLTAARGGQSPATFERLFAQSYMPLLEAIDEGLDDPRAIAALDQFRQAFAKSYSDACTMFASTGKRPTMVLDVPELAAKLTRLHGARSAQLLLVDAMRWDVGMAIQEHLVPLLATRACIAERMTLWSALPSTTLRQLETIARGTDALRNPARDDEEPEPVRARSADMVRRIRVASREIYKLDAVEVRIQRGGPIAQELPLIAESAAAALARHIGAINSRTLVLVFGDHGFAIDRHGTVHEGGASPEEVLVPAFALLVGDVH